MIQWMLRDYARDVATEPMAWLWVGTVWAGWAGAVWLATAVLPNRLKWLSLLAVAGWWHVNWMAVHREQPIERYVVMLGGYAIWQSLCFRMTKLPNWMASPLALPSRVERSQFAIGDVIWLTAACAIVLTGVRAYLPPGGGEFWVGLLVVHATLVGISVSAAFCVLAKTRLGRWLGVVGIVASVELGSFVITWMDGHFSGAPTLVRWLPYFVIETTFALWMILLALSGKRSVTLMPSP